LAISCAAWRVSTPTISANLAAARGAMLPPWDFVSWMIQPVISLGRGSMKARISTRAGFFSAHFTNQCRSASFGSTSS